MVNTPRRGRLFVVSGPSGVGKGTVVRALAETAAFHLSVSVTTRAPRPGEKDGESYHFLTRDEFERRIDDGEFLEWAEYADHLYGTPRGGIEDRLGDGVDVVLEIDIQGAMLVKEATPDAVLIFLAPPSRDELRRRIRNRGDTTNVEARLKVADGEMAVSDEFHHQVVNDELDTAVQEVAAILGRSEIPVTERGKTQ